MSTGNAVAPTTAKFAPCLKSAFTFLYGFNNERLLAIAVNLSKTKMVACLKMIYRKWSLLTGPAAILGGIVATVYVANYILVQNDPFLKPQLGDQEKVQSPNVILLLLKVSYVNRKLAKYSCIWLPRNQDPLKRTLKNLLIKHASKYKNVTTTSPLKRDFIHAEMPPNEGHGSFSSGRKNSSE
ncbi:hypothetical protein LguiB_006682 [Lonicera macranthoides]